MKNLNIVLAAMLCMSQSGFSGSGQAVYGSNELAAVSQGVLLLSAVAGSVAVTVCNSPCHGQSTLLVLTKVSHTQNACAVGLGVEVAQSLLLRVRQAVQRYVRTIGTVPLRIRENVDISFLAIAYRFGILVHLYILVRHILEVQHPVVHDILFAFRNQQMCLYHEFRIQAYEYLCMIHGFPAALINSIHSHQVQGCAVYSWLAGNTACSCITSGNCAIVK